MELDELKTLLRQKLEEDSPVNSARELETAAQKKTSSLLSKIKRNIWFEFAVFMLCIVAAAICWIAYPSLLVRLFCAATWLFSLVFSAYLYTLYRKIIFYETMPGTVKQSVRQIIGILKQFTRLYLQISMGLLPLIFIFGLITGYLDVSEQGLLQQFHWSRGMLLYSIAFIITWPTIIYFLSKWYIRKLYGNYLAQLQQQLNDIENG